MKKDAKEVLERLKQRINDSDSGDYNSGATQLSGLDMGDTVERKSTIDIPALGVRVSKGVVDKRREKLVTVEQDLYLISKKLGGVARRLGAAGEAELGAKLFNEMKVIGAYGRGIGKKLGYKER